MPKYRHGRYHCGFERLNTGNQALQMATFIRQLAPCAWLHAQRASLLPSSKSLMDAATVRQKQRTVNKGSHHEAPQIKWLRNDKNCRQQAGPYRQKACRQCMVMTGVSRTPRQIGQDNSASILVSAPIDFAIVAACSVLEMLQHKYHESRRQQLVDLIFKRDHRCRNCRDLCLSFKGRPGSQG